MSALMEIIIKGVDQASTVADKVSGKFVGAASKIDSAHKKATQSTERLSQSYQKMGSSGMSAYARLTSKQQQHYQNLSKSQAKIESLASSGTRMGNLISRGLETANNASNKVRATASKVKSVLEQTRLGSAFISSLESANSKVTAFKAKFDTVKSKITEVGSRIGSSIGRGLDMARSKIDSLNEKLGTMGNIITGAVGMIGMAGIYDLTIGLGMAREQMLTLMTATTGSASAANKLVNQLDQITNKSVVGLSELGNAMNNIKISTGMSTDQLSKIAPTVDKVGQAAILMGKDTTTAQELMTASFRGLNGEFEMLKSNFGITKQTLIDAGWSGAKDDVDGYNAALAKVLDKNLNLDGVMDSTTGKIEKIKKAFRTAGKTIGEQVVPYIEKAAEWFLALTQQFPGLTSGMILVAAGLTGFAIALPVLGSVIGGLKSLAIFLGIVKTEENALTLAQVRNKVATAASTVWSYAKAAALAVVGAAQQAYNFIMAEGTIATKIATAAQWLWNAALAANPVGIVVIAIIALIAILAYLYTSNETVRNAINWLWGALQQLGGYIYGGLLAAWNALVGALGWVWNILVQVGGYVGGVLIAAWNSMTAALAPITAALGRLWAALQQVFGGWFTSKANETNGILGALGGAFGALWDAVSGLASVIGSALAPYIAQLMVGLQILWNFLSGAFSAVWTTLSGVISAFVNYIATFIGLLGDLISGNITATEFMSQAWGAFQEMIGQVLGAVMSGIGTFVIQLIQAATRAAMGMLNSFIEFLPQIPGKFAEFLGFAIGSILKFGFDVMTTLNTLGWQLISWVITTGINFLINLGMWLYQLPGRVWTWLWLTIVKAIAWGVALRAYAIQAGSNFVKNVIQFIQQLPGKIWRLLLAAISYIASFASRAASMARSAGSRIFTGLVGAITGLPGRVWNILMQIYNKLASAGGQLYYAAASLGKQIWDGFKAGLGIHSPSYLEKAIDAIIEKSHTLPIEMKSDAKALEKINWKSGAPGFNGSTNKSTASGDGSKVVEININLKGTPQGNSDIEIAKQLLKGIKDERVLKEINIGLGRINGNIKRSMG